MMTILCGKPTYIAIYSRVAQDDMIKVNRPMSLYLLNKFCVPESANIFRELRHTSEWRIVIQISKQYE